MEAWKPDRILKVLVGWITYLFLFSWLPLIRVVFDGASYSWGTTHFGVFFYAVGVQAGAWLLVFKSGLLGTLIYGALRGANSWFRWLLVAWSAVLTADVIHGAISNPDGFDFHGETLGVHLNLGVPVVAVVVGFSLLAVYWAYRDPKRSPGHRSPPWAPRNKRLLTLFFLLLPIQFLLLRFGEPHGTTDAIGVLLTMAQCVLLPFALYPWFRSDTVA